MILHCASRPSNDTAAEAHHFDVDLDDHQGDWAAGMDAARAQVPAGHVLLHGQRVIDDE